MAEFSFRSERHAASGLSLVRICCRTSQPELDASLAFAPELGCNLLSWIVGGQEYLVDGIVTDAGFQVLGTPILYPTPNRVREGRFSFDGRAFCFTPNNGPNFIHGLVRDRAWTCEAPLISADSISVTSRFRFAPGSEAYDLFPIRNTLELTYRLGPGSVRFEFAVYNEDDAQRLPFGLAIHPYFAVIGSRELVRIQSPASYWMEAADLLPTGRLLPSQDSPADLRQAAPLSQLALDDVFYGLSPYTPQTIFYDAIQRHLVLTASELFTHSVIYTPPNRPFFCIENQSCSTDAHNLYNRGLVREAHLTILDPGQAYAAWIELAIAP